MDRVTLNDKLLTNVWDFLIEAGLLKEHQRRIYRRMYQGRQKAL